MALGFRVKERTLEKVKHLMFLSLSVLLLLDILHSLPAFVISGPSLTLLLKELLLSLLALLDKKISYPQDDFGRKRAIRCI